MTKKRKSQAACNLHALYSKKLSKKTTVLIRKYGFFIFILTCLLRELRTPSSHSPVVFHCASENALCVPLSMFSFYLSCLSEPPLAQCMQVAPHRNPSPGDIFNFIWSCALFIPKTHLSMAKEISVFGPHSKGENVLEN